MSIETNNDTTAGLLLGANSGYDDAYGEGFVDGRSSMASSVAKMLLNQMTDDEISEITGLASAVVAAIRNPEKDNPATSNTVSEPAKHAEDEATSSFSLVRENPTSATTLVEPSFVKLIRLVNNITQASLAKELGVHERTVGAWETAEMPIRMKTATYLKLQEFADANSSNSYSR